MIYVWLIAVVAFTIIELITTQFVSIWFAGGALGALISTSLGSDMTVSIIVFVLVSAILLVCTKPFVRKLLKSNTEKTNVDAHIGKVTIVTKEIDNISQTGEVVLNGVSWSARSIDNEVIKEGEKVIIEKVEGVKLIVKRQ